MDVNGFMRKSGITANLKGYEATKRAIEICIEDPNVKMTALYFIIANEFKTTTHAIERNIRHAIGKSFKNMDRSMKEALFSTFNVAPTSAQFIKQVAHAIRKGLI